MTANVIWFMINANYFPRNAFTRRNFEDCVHKNLDKIKSFVPEVTERITKDDLKTEIKLENQDNSENLYLEKLKKSIQGVPETLTRTSSSRNAENKKNKIEENSISSNSKQTYTSEDDEWLMKTRNFIYNCYTQCETPNNGTMEIEAESIENPSLLSKIDLQDLIKLYEKDLVEVNKDTNAMLGEFEKKVVESLNEEMPLNKLKHDYGNCLVDLKLNFPEDELFLAYLEKKQNEGRDLKSASTVNPGLTGGKSACNNPSSKHKERILIDDMVCYVCNDGDYTDEDLIVFCSVRIFFKRIFLILLNKEM